MPAKSRSPNLKGGSRKGVPNKVTADVKEMVLKALSEAGGAEYLFVQALERPEAFLRLVARVIPLQVKAEVSGSIELSTRLQQARERAAAARRQAEG